MTDEPFSEQLYGWNRQLSVRIALNQGLSVEDLEVLNLALGNIIKGLREVGQ